jgi:ABC-type dipeptide/oligopeptide/nickel transport system ATPase component
MDPRLIIIRGNSGSGKTTTAKQLQRELGRPTMLVSQDVIRRDMLRVRDFPGNPSIQLISDTVLFGRTIGYDVILEGILVTKHYGAMLQKLLHKFEGSAFAYYFDLPFEETLKRHNTKPDRADFGEPEMREWWNEKDYLGITQERLLDKTLSSQQVLEYILSDIPPRTRGKDSSKID